MEILSSVNLFLIGNVIIDQWYGLHGVTKYWYLKSYIIIPTSDVIAPSIIGALWNCICVWNNIYVSDDLDHDTTVLKVTWPTHDHDRHIDKSHVTH